MLTSSHCLDLSRPQGRTASLNDVTGRELFEIVPNLSSLVRPVRLAHLPTPITEARELARLWGLKSFHVKRDDLSSPVYGGSKLRNLEYFFGKALQEDATGVVTMGPYGSHQALATAVFARKLGLASRGLLVPQVDLPEVALNKRFLPMYGMEVVRCRRYVDVPRGYLKAKYSKLNGKRPFWIPPGSAHPLGVLAIVDGALEVARAIRANEIPQPDDVVVATGTCATAAGLLLGFAIAKLPVRVVAARVVPMAISGPWKLRRRARRTLKILRAHGFDQPLNWGPLLWVDSTAAPGYGLAGQEARQAMEEASCVGGLRCDITYTGKTLALLRSPVLAGRRVLFWNTLSAVTPPDLSRPIDRNALGPSLQSGSTVPFAIASGEQI